MQGKITSFGVVLLLGLAACAQQNKPKVTSRTTASGTKGEPTPWTTWSEKGTVGGLLVLKHIREHLLTNNLHDPHVDYKGHKEVDCSKQNTNFRSADGTCTDKNNAYAGAAGTAFGRNVPPEFIVKNPKADLMNPNPVQVSREFFTREEFKPVPFLNMLAASWIQFMNHDWLTHGKNSEKNPHRISKPEGGEIEVERTRVNTLDKSQYKSEFGNVTTNEVTHWWDGSQVYGSNQEEQNVLRSFDEGKMRTVKVNGRELLPTDPHYNPSQNKQNQGRELTGLRDNMWVGLSMLQHLFVLEHNAIADMLIKKHVKAGANGFYVWTNGKDVKNFSARELDEHVFQTARLINAAIMAKIHTVEWTPAILANKTLKTAMYSNWYGLANPQTWAPLVRNVPGFTKTDWFSGPKEGYLLGGIVGDKTDNYGAPFTITEEFTSVYRLHSLIPEELEIKKLSSPKKVTKVPLESSRNAYSYEMMEQNDLKDLFYSFGTQHPGQLTLNNFPRFMQNLQVPGLGSMDLGMIDIVRDRERGVPRYNQFRRAIGLNPISSYNDFFPGAKATNERQKKVLEKFRKVYGVDENGQDNVELIDLLVGTLAEEVRPKGFGFGETQFQIFILMASRRLMADRFYTESYNKENYTKSGLDWIDDQGFMHKVIARHMPELASKMKGLDTAFAPWKD
jgi:hypothetical protein